MKRWQRSWSRLILFSFAFRALVPLGLMLQLPTVSAAGEGNLGQLGFVICPIQNPSLDFSKLQSLPQEDSQQTHNHHVSHGSPDGDAFVVANDLTGSMCQLWSSSAELDKPFAAGFFTFERVNNTFLAYAVKTPGISKPYPARLTRAPPISL